MATLTTDVAVIGGGLMGAAATYTLSKRGITAIMIERNGAPGRETTARSGAIIRAHYGVPELAALANEANRRYLAFEDEVGLPCGYTRCGYTVLVDENDAAALTANVAMHKSLGVNVDLISADRAAELIPGLMTADVALAAHEPDGGFASPPQTVEAYATRAADLGARFVYGQPVVDAEAEGTAWRLALKGGDSVSASQVVVCTGNWSHHVGNLFGLDLPVRPVRAQIAVMERPEPMRGLMPVVSDLIRLAYFRMEGDDGLWAGSSDMADLNEYLPSPEGYDESAQEKTIDTARAKCAHRFLPMSGCSPNALRGFAGLYETTPDWQPIIDSPVSNLHLAVGFSGHGFKLAPVVGEILAGAVCNLPARREARIFRLSRFADGTPITAKYSYSRAKFLR